MGFFSAIKDFFNFRKELKKSIAEAKENEARYLTMSIEELSALSDDELFEAVASRTESKVDNFEDLADGVNSLNNSQKIFHSLNWFEMEVNNGGLCQFFVNSSRIVAPLVSEYMGIIGAEEHKKLYDDFVDKNDIDLSELSYFNIAEVEDFEEKNQSYPFDEYDDKFYEMEPLETYLKKYIKEHLEDFWGDVFSNETFNCIYIYRYLDFFALRLFFPAMKKIKPFIPKKESFTIKRQTHL